MRHPHPPNRNDLGQLGLGHNRSPWEPDTLPGFRAVHPDRTLRKSKRALPRMRLIAADKAATAGTSTETNMPADAKTVFFFAPATKNAKQLSGGSEDNAAGVEKASSPAPSAAAPAPATATDSAGAKNAALAAQ